MKVTIKKEEKKPFADHVEVRETKVRDIIKAQAVSGEEKGFKFLLAVFAEIGTFDGKRLVMEDLLEMSSDDFFSLQQGLEEAGLQELSTQLSSAKETESSPATT